MSLHMHHQARSTIWPYFCPTVMDWQPNPPALPDLQDQLKYCSLHAWDQIEFQLLIFPYDFIYCVSLLLPSEDVCLNTQAAAYFCGYTVLTMLTVL